MILKQFIRDSFEAFQISVMDLLFRIFQPFFNTVQVIFKLRKLGTYAWHKSRIDDFYFFTDGGFYMIELIDFCFKTDLKIGRASCREREWSWRRIVVSA